MSGIITVADVKSFLSGIPSASTASDTTITALISQNQKKAEAYLGYPLEKHTYDEIIQGDNSNMIRCSHLPVNAEPTIKDLEDVETDHVIQNFDDKTKRSGCFILDKAVIGFVKLSYTAGYTDTAGTGNIPVPDDIKQAVIKLVASDLLQGKVFNSMDEAESNAYTPASFRRSAYAILDMYKSWGL